VGDARVFASPGVSGLWANDLYSSSIPLLRNCKVRKKKNDFYAKVMSKFTIYILKTGRKIFSQRYSAYLAAFL
jgi:hypothetical protein